MNLTLIELELIVTLVRAHVRALLLTTEGIPDELKTLLEKLNDEYN